MLENAAECIAAGLDPAKVRKIALRIERAAKEARAMGIQVFGGSCGSLRYDSGSGGPLILAELDGNWSGGCGASMRDDDGLLRGEV